ncbi:MAG: cell division protein FtsA [Parcubacteria group bacterium LiPW_72]|nr:MAG: cell division protein FtsA [Parcubacteria group bacterium LiPW_72]
MPRQEIISGIDLGSANIRVIIVERGGLEDKPRILGIGESPSFGIRKGIIVDVEEIVTSISSALEKAERMAGSPVGRAYVSVGGAQVSYLESRGVIAISRADGEISKNDVSRVIEAASAVSISSNREILHILPRDFIVDDEGGIKDPVGMNGVRLEAVTTIVETSSSLLNNLTRCVERTGVDVAGLVFAPLASAWSVLEKRQRDLGVVLIDLGGGSTSFSVYEEGGLLSGGALPVGGEHISSDLAIGLRTSMDTAERVKIEYGSCLPREIDKQEEIDLQKVVKQEKGVVSRREVAEIIEARGEEIFKMIDKELHKIGRSAQLPAGAVLVGGGAKLPGVVDLAKEILRLPAQIGFPMGLSISVDKVDDPVFATATGLIHWGLGEGNRFSFEFNREGLTKLNSGMDRMKRWFKNFLP